MTNAIPEVLDLPFDGHMHTDLSADSDVPIDVYGALAAARGLTELAITDHVDFEPGAPSYDRTTFEQRERYVRDAAERWAAHGVTIRFGVELTYDRLWEADVREHLAKHRYDFTIGSVHNRVDSLFGARRVAAWVGGRTLAEIVEPSFVEVVAAARSGLFDTIGHIDSVKRFLWPHVTPDQLAAAPELYEPILAALVESGTALEINTSGLRHPVQETYPSAAIVARFIELGGRRVTIGSDSHRSTHFGVGLADGYAYAAANGLDHLTVGRTGRTIAIPSRFADDRRAG